MPIASYRMQLTGHMAARGTLWDMQCLIHRKRDTSAVQIKNCLNDPGQSAFALAFC